MAAAAAQAGMADHYTADGLTQEMEKLKAQAAATGSASETLQRYANHFTMLAYRTKNGSAEIHRQFADMFYIVRGRATLVTGGTLAGAKEESPGELRGTAVEGGALTALGPGDVVNIPAGTPHQLLVAAGDEFLYFVVKVKESD
jgi:mannose-6-phosphate isomerase-like protein (cupin superfamily)